MATPKAGVELVPAFREADFVGPAVEFTNGLAPTVADRVVNWSCVGQQRIEISCAWGWGSDGSHSGGLRLARLAGGKGYA